VFFFSSRRRHTRSLRDWSSDVCSSDLLRQPTVSNTQIAFAYAGDIWVAGRDGGDAKRLTSFPGTESNPHFSPDGKQIAFSMQYRSEERRVGKEGRSRWLPYH